MRLVDVAVVAYDGAELADVACVTTAFDLAARLRRDDRLRVALVTLDGSDVRCDSGIACARTRR